MHRAPSVCHSVAKVVQRLYTGEGHRYGSVCTVQYGFFILQGFCGREKEKENVNNKNKTSIFSQPAVFFLTAFSVIDGARVLECLFNFDLHFEILTDQNVL